MTPLLLGIDGGGTKTVGVLADENGDEIRRREVGPTNYRAVGLNGAEANLRALIGHLCDDFGGIGAVDSAALGLAGVGRPVDWTRFTCLLYQLGFPKRTLLTHDARIALAGGAGEDRGAILIAGTGSICYGRNDDGAEARCGGWGSLLDDAGSGYALGMAGLRAVVRHVDGRVMSASLHDRAREYCGVRDAADLVGWVHSADKSAVAGFATDVFAACESGDDEAAKIVSSGASALAEMAAVVYRKLDWRQPPKLVMAGGVLLEQRRYFEAVCDAVDGLDLDIRPHRPVSEPAIGAVQLASFRLG